MSPLPGLFKFQIPSDAKGIMPVWFYPVWHVPDDIKSYQLSLDTRISIFSGSSLEGSGLSSRSMTVGKSVINLAFPAEYVVIAFSFFVFWELFCSFKGTRKISMADFCRSLKAWKTLGFPKYLSFIYIPIRAFQPVFVSLQLALSEKFCRTFLTFNERTALGESPIWKRCHLGS